MWRTEATAAQAGFQQQLAEAAAAAAAADLFNSPPSDTSEGAEDQETQLDDDQRQEAQQHPSDAAQYFRRRLQQKADEEAAAGSTMLPSTAAQHPLPTRQQQQSCSLPLAKKLQLPSHQLETLDLSWQRAYSAASLANAAVDAATPLLLQRRLQAAVLAASVVSAALDALGAATRAIESEERLFEDFVDRGPEAALQPTRPAPAKLLPAVHAVWPMLLACLQVRVAGGAGDEGSS